MYRQTDTSSKRFFSAITTSDIHLSSSHWSSPCLLSSISRSKLQCHRSAAIRSQSRWSQEPVELLSPCFKTLPITVRCGTLMNKCIYIQAEHTDLTVSGQWLDPAWTVSVSIPVIIDIYALINANVRPRAAKHALVEFMYTFWATTVAVLFRTILWLMRLKKTESEKNTFKVWR